MDNLVTEAGDQIVTERGNPILTDGFVTCSWPTLQQVKDELGVTDPAEDATIQRMINASISSIERYLGYHVPAQVQEIDFSLSDCEAMFGYTHTIQSPRWPIQEIIECTDITTGQQVDHAVEDSGRICGNWQTFRKVHIKLHGGVCPIPDDLLTVFYQMVSYRYAQRNASGGAAAGTIKKESIPNVYHVEYFSGVEGQSSASFADAKAYSDTLDSYRTYFV